MTWTYDLFSDVDNFERTVEGPRSEWDTLILNGLAVPGVVTVTASVDTGMDTQKAKNAKRAYIVNNGSNPVKFSFTLKLQPGELAEFSRSTLPLLRPPTKSGQQEKLRIYHPEAALWGVTTIRVTSVNSSPPVSGGLKTITWKAVEDVGFAPVKKKSKPVPTEAENGDIRDALLTVDLRDDVFNNQALKDKAGF